MPREKATYASITAELSELNWNHGFSEDVVLFCVMSLE